MKKTGRKKVSSTLKKLIEELLTDIVPVSGKSLEETNVTNEAGGIFLQLFNRINNAETKNENASRDLIFSYFNFGEAVYK